MILGPSGLRSAVLTLFIFSSFLWTPPRNAEERLEAVRNRQRKKCLQTTRSSHLEAATKRKDFAISRIIRAKAKVNSLSDEQGSSKILTTDLCERGLLRTLRRNVGEKACRINRTKLQQLRSLVRY